MGKKGENEIAGEYLACDQEVSYVIVVHSPTAFVYREFLDRLSIASHHREEDPWFRRWCTRFRVWGPVGKVKLSKYKS